MKRNIREIEPNRFFDRIDQSGMSELEKRLAKANFARAELLVELIVWVINGVEHLARLLVVKPVRRGVALVSKPAD
jgi:hypothetical protein